MAVVSKMIPSPPKFPLNIVAVILPDTTTRVLFIIVTFFRDNSKRSLLFQSARSALIGHLHVLNATLGFDAKYVRDCVT